MVSTLDSERIIIPIRPDIVPDSLFEEGDNFRCPTAPETRVIRAPVLVCRSTPRCESSACQSHELSSASNLPYLRSCVIAETTEWNIPGLLQEAWYPSSR
ncbi:hypothetical protein CC2G_003380 [Coprinopsis cinerea AmutBmut pab1-1]|nr:hypothetical protein CC2G_003380 [Coprinopsis cinerea AmutBmut pab1-1]